ncbi:glycoside hydrolase/deacetylase [Meredithblackwellia eburnea MCA 4105]
MPTTFAPYETSPDSAPAPAGANTGDFKEFLPPRDFVGYGTEPPKDPWPKGAKIAVCFVLNYEEGSEHTVWNGDSGSEPFLHEHHYHRQNVKGRRDIVVESSFEYGVRAGLPRLIKLFRKFGWQFTLWANGRAFEVSGDYPKILAEDGHEIACHGNRWTAGPTMTGYDDEARHVRQGFKRLQKSTGLKDVPTAWFGGAGTMAHKHIRARVHKETGVPLLYCSDTYSDDIPYYLPSPLAMDGDKDEGLLMIPYSLTNNDHRFMVSQGAGTGAPNEWFELLQADFDYLYEEGKNGSPKMMTVAMHNRILGKPARSRALKKFMEYIKDKPDVWVTTRADMAHHWREKFPYEKVGPTMNLHQDLYKA